jgi:translation initiation factor 2 gamma subunit (eIF-2gamma)
MIEIQLHYADEKGKRCPKCKIKNHISNTLCWFCNNKFERKEKYNETKT